MKVFEGTSESGESYRMVSAFFEGKGGNAMLSVAGYTEKWDAEMVDDLLASMK